MEGPLLVTGGAGFIGSAFVLNAVHHRKQKVLTLDKMTYAGRAENLAPIESNPLHLFAKGDIADIAFVASLLQTHRPRAIVHFAAESHVDRSIEGPEAFVQTNVVGTYRLLEATRVYLETLSPEDRTSFRFLHVSTDEVYGTLGLTEAPWTESSPYLPNSPYAASKAASDHFVRAYGKTYGLPTLITHSSNNYGPRQYPEKLIPHMIERALSHQPLPIYGDGKNKRDWLFVEDHIEGLQTVLEKGAPGETYAIAGEAERENLFLVQKLCTLLDALRPRPDGVSYKNQIIFVKDRPGHDLRYALDAKRLKDLGWTPRTAFDEGLDRTVRWYLANETFLHPAEEESRPE